MKECQLSPTEHQRLTELRSMSRFGLKHLFWTLPAPAIHQVAGNYLGDLLDQGRSVERLGTRFAFALRGQWIGKSFLPTSEVGGVGLNSFGSIVDPRFQLPMDTYIAPSRFLPGDSFILDYSHRNRGPIRFLRGELRVIGPSLLLGMGIFGPADHRWRRLRRVIPFVLVRASDEFASMIPQAFHDKAEALSIRRAA